MITLTGSRLDLRRISRHHYICDLLEFDGPVLSLYSDGRQSWLYLWCDTDGVDTNRWLLFKTTRSELVAYLERKATLLAVLEASLACFILDAVSREPSSEDARQQSYRQLRSVPSLSDLEEYLPTGDSYFEESLAPDIDMARELIPRSFLVPINNNWFAVDFNDFFKSYARIYAFFYAARPQFVKSIRGRMEELLRAPWKGGYSRINFFATLPQLVPALHGLRVPEMNFASPGDIKFEALESVGRSIKNSVLRLAANETGVDHALNAMKVVLSAARLNKVDLSKETDASLNLGADAIAMLLSQCSEIARTLDMAGEFNSLRTCSPNAVVYSKAVAGLMTQMKHLAQFQSDGLLELDRSVPLT